VAGPDEQWVHCAALPLLCRVDESVQESTLSYHCLCLKAVVHTVMQSYYGMVVMDFLPQSAPSFNGPRIFLILITLLDHVTQLCGDSAYLRY